MEPLNSNWLFIKPTKINRGVLQSAGGSQTSDTQSLLSRFSSASQLANFNRMKEKAKKMIVDQQRNNITPVFMQNEGERMNSIIERDEDLSSEMGPQLTLKNLAEKNRFNSNRTTLESSPSHVEPMIKQMKLKREKITGKQALRILDL